MCARESDVLTTTSHYPTLHCNHASRELTLPENHLFAREADVLTITSHNPSLHSKHASRDLTLHENHLFAREADVLTITSHKGYFSLSYITQPLITLQACIKDLTLHENHLFCYADWGIFWVAAQTMRSHCASLLLHSSEQVQSVSTNKNAQAQKNPGHYICKRQVIWAHVGSIYSSLKKKKKKKLALR